jgi:hypothetical protein
MLHGCAPVKATDKLADPPAQMEVEPLRTAVGNDPTVISALPIKDVPMQLASLTAVKV